MTLAQLVGLAEMSERLLVAPDVVEILAERIVKIDLLRVRQLLREQRFGALEPPGILEPHLAMGGDAAITGRKIRIDCNGPLEQLLRFAKLPAIGAQLPEQAQCRGVAWINCERRPAAGFRIVGAVLLPACDAETQ